MIYELRLSMATATQCGFRSRPTFHANWSPAQQLDLEIGQDASRDLRGCWLLVRRRACLKTLTIPTFQTGWLRQKRYLPPMTKWLRRSKSQLIDNFNPRIGSARVLNGLQCWPNKGDKGIRGTYHKSSLPVERTHVLCVIYWTSINVQKLSKYLKSPLVNIF